MYSLCWKYFSQLKSKSSKQITTIYFMHCILQWNAEWTWWIFFKVENIKKTTTIHQIKLIHFHTCSFSIDPKHNNREKVKTKKMITLCIRNIFYVVYDTVINAPIKNFHFHHFVVVVVVVRLTLYYKLGSFWSWYMF